MGEKGNEICRINAKPFREITRCRLTPCRPREQRIKSITIRKPKHHTAQRRWTRKHRGWAAWKQDPWQQLGEWMARHWCRCCMFCLQCQPPKVQVIRGQRAYQQASSNLGYLHQQQIHQGQRRHRNLLSRVRVREREHQECRQQERLPRELEW
jgi:hypothetical protein